MQENSKWLYKQLRNIFATINDKIYQSKYKIKDVNLIEDDDQETIDTNININLNNYLKISIKQALLFKDKNLISDKKYKSMIKDLKLGGYLPSFTEMNNYRKKINKDISERLVTIEDKASFVDI